MCKPTKFMTIVLLALLWSLQVQAQDVPQFIHYQGNLASTNGNPVNSNLQMIFRIYDQETGGSALWTEIHDGVAVEEGLFSVVLGSVDPANNPITSELFSGESYLDINIAGEPLDPRQKIGSLPFALVAQSVPESGPQFIEPVEVSQGNSPLAFTIFDASPNLPEGAKAVILEAEGVMAGPDVAADIDAHIRIRANDSSPSYVLLRGRSAVINDNLGWASQGIFPISENRTFQFTVEAPGFKKGYAIRLIGYFK